MIKILLYSTLCKLW